MRARVQELERGAEPHEASQPTPPTVITVGSSPSSQASENRGRAPRQPLSDDAGVPNTITPEALTTVPQGHLSLVKAGTTGVAPNTLPERASPSMAADTVAAGSNETLLSPAPRPPRTAAEPIAEVEPVRIERRPNPYADVPSLYDLYVQANPRPQKLERFGLEVFRNGTADPDALPMDLPVGPTM